MLSTCRLSHLNSLRSCTPTRSCCLAPSNFGGSRANTFVTRCLEGDSDLSIYFAYSIYTPKCPPHSPQQSRRHINKGTNSCSRVWVSEQSKVLLLVGCVFHLVLFAWQVMQFFLLGIAHWLIDCFSTAGRNINIWRLFCNDKRR